MSDLPRIDLEADFPTDLDAELQAVEASAADAESGSAGADDDASPVVVIQYRNRGIPPFLMFPLALVVSLAMFAAYHYFVVKPKNLELQKAAIRAAAVAELFPERTSDQGDDSKPQPGPLAGLPLPLTLESQPLPPGYELPPPSFKEESPPAADDEREPPLTAAAGDDSIPKAAPQIGDRLNWNGEEGPEAVAAARPDKPASPPPAVGFSRPSDRPAAEDQAEPEAIAMAPEPDIVAEPPKDPDPAEEPPLSRDEMLQAIQDEAVAKAAQREDLLRKKEEARARVEAEAQQRIEDERTAFRKALHQILTAGEPDAGRQIDALCNQFGRNYSDEIRNRVTAYLSRVHGRITVEEEIRLLRTLGVPEPGILDFLANGVKISVNSRKGPRNPDEVRVRAARRLLQSRPVITEVDAARASSVIPRFPAR